MSSSLAKSDHYAATTLSPLRQEGPLPSKITIFTMSTFLWHFQFRMGWKFISGKSRAGLLGTSCIFEENVLLGEHQFVRFWTFVILDFINGDVCDDFLLKDMICQWYFTSVSWLVIKGSKDLLDIFFLVMHFLLTRVHIFLEKMQIKTLISRAF